MAFTFTPSAFELKLRSLVIGYDGLVRHLYNAFHRCRLEWLRRPERPIAVFLLGGEHETVKLPIARTLAEIFHGGPENVHRFDLQDYAGSQKRPPDCMLSRLFGDGSSEGELLAALRERPDAVVLLESFDLADPCVQKRFLAMWNDGFAARADTGDEVRASQATFILTTALSNHKFWQVAAFTGCANSAAQDQAKEILSSAVAPEVLSRIDRIFAVMDEAGDFARTGADHLKYRISGQDAAIEGLTRDLAMRCYGRQDRRHVVYLLCGPRESGKTALGMALAEWLDFDPNRPYFFLDFDEFGVGKDAVSALFGSPPGCGGAEGRLTETIAVRRPRAVLLDQIEKADPDVAQRLAAMFRDGTVTDDRTGQRHALDDTVFVLTTGTDCGTHAPSGGLAEHITHREALGILASRARDNALPRPLLDAIDRVFVLRPLGKADVLRAVALQIGQSMTDHGFRIAGGRKSLFEATERCVGSELEGGVRDVARQLGKQIEGGLAKAKAAGATTVSLESGPGRLAIVPIGSQTPGKMEA